MTIPFSGSGSVFNIIGRYIGQLNNVNGFRGATAPDTTAHWGSSGPKIGDLADWVANLIAQHTSAQESYYDGIRSVQNAYVTAHDPFCQALAAAALAELTAIVTADTPLPNTQPATVLQQLILQMKANAQTVQQCTVGDTVTAASGNVGTPVIVASALNTNGNVLEYAFAENLIVATTSDRNVGATQGSEPLSITGTANTNANKLQYTWPTGSAGAASITVTDPNSASAILANGNFETFANLANVPDNWTLAVGTAGTHTLKSTGTTYGNGSSASLQIVGDGTNLTSLTQVFANGGQTGGNTTTLKLGQVYAWNFWLYCASLPTAGVLQVDIVDGSGTIITDNAGNSNSVSINLHSGLAPSTWTSLSGFFRLPTNVPSTIKLRIHLTTAMTAAATVNIDFGAMVAATQVYAPNGPYVAAFRSAVDTLVNDYWTVAITNNRGGLFVTGFERLFGMTGFTNAVNGTNVGLLLPSAASSPTIADSLVTV